MLHQSSSLTIAPLRNQPAPNGQLGLEELLARNEKYLAEFEMNPLFGLVRSSYFESETVRARFLDCFQVWSDKYQKMVLTRAIVCDDTRFAGITEQHTREEFGHNTDLAAMREGRPSHWDPILEATANWFPWKILTCSEIEKIVLVHTVVESSATIFYKHVMPALQPKKDRHFNHHNVVDHDHQNMGMDELRDLRPAEYERLAQIQSEGWQMLGAVMSRIAEIAGDRAIN